MIKNPFATENNKKKLVVLNDDDDDEYDLSVLEGFRRGGFGCEYSGLRTSGLEI